MKADVEGGVVLADGTRLGDLIDREHRTFRSRIHADPEVFELELEKIFARVWIPVAHVTEFDRAGDFVTRTIGRDPVLVTLDGEGEFNVMLNVCTHRGGQVCSAEVGNAAAHRCPFHGWTFDPDGSLLGVPFERLVYGGRLGRSELRLWKARVDVAAGIIFATWDEDAPGLDEFLGDFRFYLDTMLCRTDEGLEVAGPPQRFVIDANWKVVGEGFFGDAYHVPSVHQSFMDLGVTSRSNEAGSVGNHFKASINGHSVIAFDFEGMGLEGDPADLLPMMPPVGMPPELVPGVLASLPPDTLDVLAHTPPSIVGVFPSTSVLMINTGPGSPIGAVCSVRFFVPLGPERTEVVSFTLVERAAAQEFKDRVHNLSASAFGVGGMFEADDAEVWAGVQRGVQGVIGRRMRDNYDAVSEPYSDPVRPGEHTFRGPSSDDNQWLFYERYFDLLEGRA